MQPYILFGAFVARKGKENELLTILNGGHDMNNFPGCQEYRVYQDATQKEMLWIFEVWDTVDAHKKSLEDPVIKNQISQAMPLIESFPHHFTLLKTP